MKFKKITGFLVMAIMFTLILSMTIFTASADTDLTRVADGIVKKDDGTSTNWVEIDFLNDTVKAGFDVAYYTVDGTKWVALSIEKNAAEGVNIAKIIDKGGKLKFTSAIDSKTGAPQKEVTADPAKEIEAVAAAITVDFGTVDARPAPPKFKPNYNAKNSGEDGLWTLWDGKTTVLKEADWEKYVIVESDKSGKAPAEVDPVEYAKSYGYSSAGDAPFAVVNGIVQWQAFEPLPVKPLDDSGKSVKTTYMVKSVLIATDAKITPPSKAAKVAVSGYGKPAKVKVDYKKEIVTLKGDMMYDIGAAFVYDKGVTKEKAKLGVKFADIFKDSEVTYTYTDEDGNEETVSYPLEFANEKYVYGIVWIAGTDKKPPTAEYELIVNGPSELAINTTLAKFTEDTEALAGGLNESKHTYKLPKGYEVLVGGKWVTSVKTAGTYDVRIKSTAKFNEKSMDWEAFNKPHAENPDKVTGATAENCMMSGKTASNVLKLKVGKGKYEDSKGNKKDGIIFITLLDPRDAVEANEDEQIEAEAAPEYLIAGGSDVSAATADKLDIKDSDTEFTVKLTGATFTADADETSFTIKQGTTDITGFSATINSEKTEATITLDATPAKGKITVTILADAVEPITGSGFKAVAATGVKFEVEIVDTTVAAASTAADELVKITNGAALGTISVPATANKAAVETAIATKAQTLINSAYNVTFAATEGADTITAGGSLTVSGKFTVTHKTTSSDTATNDTALTGIAVSVGALEEVTASGITTATIGAKVTTSDTITITLEGATFKANATGTATGTDFILTANGTNVTMTSSAGKYATTAGSNEVTLNCSGGITNVAAGTASGTFTIKIDKNLLNVDAGYELPSGELIATITVNPA